MTLTRFDIAHQRLRNQRISAAIPGKPDELVAWLCAVQAQDYAGAKWSLGLRLQAATDGNIDRAFAEGTILRTHAMRPTWHFVSPADIRWLLALTAGRVHAANAYMYRKLGLDGTVFSRSNAALARALQGGRQLTRDELRDVLEKAGIATDGGLHLSYLMMQAELDGLICSGARRGKQFTYALLDERVAPAVTLGRDAALAELARRYFLSRGPATLQDFAKWSGLTVADAGHGLEAVRDRLQHETIEAQTYWFAPPTARGKEASPAVHLLSIFDEYISGYKDRSAIGEAEVGARLIALGNALSYIIVIDGQITGTWKRTLRKDAVVVHTDPFTPLTEPQAQALATTAQRYGAFLGLPVILA